MRLARLPGFTAEAAIVAGQTQHYRGVHSGAMRVDQPITAEILRPWRPKPDCNPNCVCVSPYGCPCCVGPGPGWPYSSMPWDNSMPIF
jgi:hypothetical protein